jgi:phytoene synthase
MNPLGVFRSSSFAPAFLFLSGPRRRALQAVYAFCRAADDAVDDVGVDGGRPEEARRLLNAWRRVVDAPGATPPPELDASLVAALAEARRSFNIPARPLHDLLNGVERDLTQTRYETFEETLAYCYGVASTVGLACLPIFGLPEEPNRDFAVKLGLAVQMVNILRDVTGDARRDRIYLPQEDLRRFGVSPEDLLEGRCPVGRHGLMMFQAARAQALFDAARSALPSSSRRAARPARLMGALYQTLLLKMIRRRFPAGPPRLRLNIAEKIFSLTKI